MQLPLIELPQIAPQRPERPTQDNIPPTREVRERIRQYIQTYVEQEKPVPPLAKDELQRHSEHVLNELNLDEKFIDYVAVLIGNEAWRDQIASVPFDRRLLLLPKCLRHEERCPAPFDEFGLLCKQCGLCTIQDLQNEAERLGYAVLTAEGSAIVMAIIETGKIDAIVGVSCLSVLERAFPYMEAAAIPGVAIPLLQDDCKDTNIDIEWVWDYIHFTSDDKTRRLNLDELRREVQSWFEPAALDALLGPAKSHPEQVARDWLTRDGKRWRPFLAVCVYAAMQDDPNDVVFTDDLKRVAVAVECFHKASLVHDDIEDGDDKRYDSATLHAEHGVPIALNVGDLLLGDGYKLLAEVEAEPAVRAEMVRVAADGHRQLSIGQGEELHLTAEPRPLRSLQVLEIFKRKTAPAFDVALQLGAVYGGRTDAADGLRQALGEYSEALGIAYQVRDDLDDFGGDIDSHDAEAVRLSILQALAHEKADKDDKQLLADVWSRDRAFNDVADDVKRICDELGVEERARELLDIYKEQAIRSLRTVENANLKGLLRRVVGKVFNDLEIKGWCSEYEARATAGSPVSADAAG